MYYTVYRITNIINNKIYIGIHATDDLDDGYMGSGDKIKEAIKKHGVENFKKEILFVYNTLDAALLTESEIVDEDFIKRTDTYNITLGGGLPPAQKGKSRKSNKQSLKGDQRTEAQKLASKKRSELLKGTPAWNKGKPGIGRAVKTPDGIFRTGLEACKYYNITTGTLHNRCKKKLYGFEFYDDRYNIL